MAMTRARTAVKVKETQSVGVIPKARIPTCERSAKQTQTSTDHTAAFASCAKPVIARIPSSRLWAISSSLLRTGPFFGAEQEMQAELENFKQAVSEDVGCDNADCQSHRDGAQNARGCNYFSGCVFNTGDTESENAENNGQVKDPL